MICKQMASLCPMQILHWHYIVLFCQCYNLLQADDSDDACANIGSLFDESAAEATDSAHFQDFGAAEGEDVTGVL